MRLLGQIRDAVDSVSPSSSTLCDIFTGSATVAYSFSQDRRVVAADVQEYSRVLASALLNPPDDDRAELEELMERLDSQTPQQALHTSIGPLIEFEHDCVSHSNSGVFEPFCDLLERGSIVQFMSEPESSKPDLLTERLNTAIRALASESLIDSSRSLVTRYFGGVYFSFVQAAELDFLLECVANLSPGNRDTALAAVLSVASDVVSTVGNQFAQPIKPRDREGNPKTSLLNQAIRARSIDVRTGFRQWLTTYLSIPDSGLQHSSVRADFRETLNTLPEDVGVIYADPPYTRDHYSRFYHVLETMCFRDNPTLSTNTVGGVTKTSRGLYRSDRHQSPFSIKSRAKEAFDTLFKGASSKNLPLVVSYSPFTGERSRPRLLTVSELLDIAGKYYKNTDFSSIETSKHSKLNTSRLNVPTDNDAEIMLVCSS